VSLVTVGLRDGLYRHFLSVSSVSKPVYFAYKLIILRLLAAWAGSLMNGPLADHLGRKTSMILAVVIFTAGSAVQAGAENTIMLFLGKAMALSLAASFTN
jgi:MFS family permease